MNEEATPATIDATLARVDDGWADFQRLVSGFPAEHLDERLPAGWTRKQMLAHITAWHDLTCDRLAAFLKDGDEQPLYGSDDVINARVARAAEGRTTGEIFDSLEVSYRRLRRQISQLADEQLQAHDGWTSAVIAANTYDHYAEHRADLGPPNE